MNKNFKKIEIATMVSFTCVSYLSSFNLVHATQTFSEVCATDKNIITTQKVDVRKNNANNQTKTQSGIYFDNEELHSHNHKTIAGMANYLNKENALGIASTFHIFAQNTTLNVDTNGNVATNNLNSNVDFGT